MPVLASPWVRVRSPTLSGLAFRSSRSFSTFLSAMVASVADLALPGFLDAVLQEGTRRHAGTRVVWASVRCSSVTARVQRCVQHHPAHVLGEPGRVDRAELRAVRDAEVVELAVAQRRAEAVHVRGRRSRCRRREGACRRSGRRPRRTTWCPRRISARSASSVGRVFSAVYLSMSSSVPHSVTPELRSTPRGSKLTRS